MNQVLLELSDGLFVFKLCVISRISSCTTLRQSTFDTNFIKIYRNIPYRHEEMILYCFNAFAELCLSTNTLIFLSPCFLIIFVLNFGQEEQK